MKIEFEKNRYTVDESDGIVRICIRTNIGLGKPVTVELVVSEPGSSQIDNKKLNPATSEFKNGK